MKKICSNNNGQAMAEFALVFPVILLLVLGIMQLALIANAQFLLNYAAYAAARAGVVQASPANSNNTMRLAAAAICYPLDRLSVMKISIDRSEIVGGNLEVELTFHYHLIIPTVKGLFGGRDTSTERDWWTYTGTPHLPMHARCAMLIESPGPGG